MAVGITFDLLFHIITQHLLLEETYFQSYLFYSSPVQKPDQNGILYTGQNVRLLNHYINVFETLSFLLAD